MANRIVTATVTGETIKLSNKTAGAAGSFNAVSLAFTFDSAWDGTTKKIYFFDRDGANAVYRLLTSDLLVDGAYIVPIPAEPLAYSGEMTITVRGVELDGETAERIIMSASTTMKVLNAEVPASDVAPVEPTPTQAEQLQAEIDNIIDEVAAVPAQVTAAANSANAALTSANNASASATSAHNAQLAAESARDDAESTASAFDAHASSVTSAFDSNASAANATIDGKVTTATNAASAAQTAQGLSEGARDSAITAKTDAQTARTGAQTAQTAAELAETHAKTSETNAGTYATNASNSATSASGSASDANNAKTAAQTAQANAELAETHAETAETNAETAETNATAKAVLSESYAKGGTGTRSGEDTDNALYYKNQAAAIVGGDYPTKTEAQGYVTTHNADGTAHSTQFASKQATTDSLTAETALADGDYVPFYDTSVTAHRKTLWSNIKSVLKTYFDTLYATVSHVHGNITNAGAIGSTANLPVVTTTSGVLTTSTAQAMGGLLGDGYGTCSTAAATAAKVVTCSGFSLVKGGFIAVKFTNTDTSTTPTLNVNSTGAKSIYYNGATITAGMINSGLTAYFTYNGTQYELINPFPTTIGAATSTHTHGNLTNDGKIGATADLPVFTGTSGAVNTKSIADAKTLLGISDPSYVKLLDTTVSTAAQSISLDLSSLSTTQYSSLNVVYFSAVGVGFDPINVTINGITSGYYGKLSSATARTETVYLSQFFSTSTAKFDLTYNGSNSSAQNVMSHLIYGLSNQAVDYSSVINATLSAGITSITFTANSISIPIGSKFTVYGVKK